MMSLSNTDAKDIAKVTAPGGKGFVNKLLNSKSDPWNNLQGKDNLKECQNLFCSF